METHIATVLDKSQKQSIHELKWHDLHAANHIFNKNFRLYLEDGQFIDIQKILRVMPKKRMVAFGTWMERPVVIKLFFDAHKARRHMEKDVNGVNFMAMNKIPTSVLCYQGVSADRRTYVLIYERIFGGQSLEEIWQQHRHELHKMLSVLKSVLVELATHHVLGVRQQDLHFKNFLLLDNQSFIKEGNVVAKKQIEEPERAIHIAVNKRKFGSKESSMNDRIFETDYTIYTLDGGQVDFKPRILDKEISIQSIALFLSQLGIGMEKYQESLFKYYAKLRGWLLKDQDISEFFTAVKSWSEDRWKNFERKIFRNSTEYVTFKHHSLVGMLDRNYAGPGLLNLLKNPESVFQHPNTHILKAGRSATVLVVSVDDHLFVVKKYNMKNIWHRLRRCLRITRAAKSWRLAHKLHFFGIATAKPIAYIEKRILGLRSYSYFVSEYISGEHAGHYFEKQVSEQKIATITQRICALLKDLKKLEISHGDLKITNILIHQDQPYIIDMDGAIEHTSAASLRHRWKQEIKRFLKNFSKQVDIQNTFKQLLE